MSPHLTVAVMIAFFAAAQARAESFQSWAARGAREEREKDPKAAFSSYSNALSLWKDGDSTAVKAKVLCARAGLREKDGDDAGAIGDLSDCLSLDKKNSKGFHRRGALLLKAGKAPAAIGDFYRAVALDIGFAQAYADRARAYESQGELGFAYEDYRNACSLGVKPACAKARALTPKGKAKLKEPPAEAAAGEPPAEEAPAEAPAPSAKQSSAPAPYRPRFKDCVASLDSCVENGGSFGTCVRSAPSCDAKPVRGCCPAACLKAYQKSINLERSEAAAYREHFAPEAACSIPPKAEEDD
jgi:tetratricopeptide (TPR) repeat protein